MNKFYQLEVIKIQQETADAISLSLRIPKRINEMFQFKPGQYLTLRFIVNGKEERRSYSICCPPNDLFVKIGVKRLQGGLISNYIHDHIKVGDTIESMPPNGKFCINLNPTHHKSYYLFAAGSGITPILSIIHSVLEKEPNSYLYLLYGNKNKHTIMFESEINQLAMTHENFMIQHTLSTPKTVLFGGLFNKQNDNRYHKGRINKKAIETFITNHQPIAQDTSYYICGPTGMIENTKIVLIELDVPENRIHLEYFSTGNMVSSVQPVPDALLVATIDGESIKTTIPKGKTILRTLIDYGAEPPFSCEGGVCSTCICKLKKGSVHMNNNAVLVEEELQQGYILSCQSIPTSNSLEIEFE